MIPLQLTLRNFLSYREGTELDLSGIHLACISGLNGAGKSSILDAITWALFGKSRVKSDDDLVNRIAAANGAAAEVDFVFELEGAIYRVIRRKAAGKTTELEFQARAKGVDGERWQALTEAKLKETQAALEKLLRMNYDVFTNASFLLQGQADEFTTKTPDKRKEILAEILGVNMWDTYKDLAAERRKGAENEGTVIERRLAEVETELSHEEELTRALELAEANVRAMTAERDRQDALVAAARQNKTMADHQRQLLRRLTADLAESRRELEHVGTLIAQRKADLQAHQSLLDRRTVIESQFKAWQIAESEFGGWQEKAEQHALVVGEKHPLEMEIAKVEAQLEQRLKALEQQRESAETATTELELLRAQVAVHKQQLSELQEKAAELVADEQAWQQARTEYAQIDNNRKLWNQELVQLESRSNQIARLELEKEQTAASKIESQKSLDKTLDELTYLDEKKNTLGTKKTEKAGLEGEQNRLREEMHNLKVLQSELMSDDDQDCPLCGQTLTIDHRQTVMDQLQADGDARGAQFRRNKAAIEELDREIGELERALQRQTTLEKERESRQAAVTRMEARLSVVEEQIVAWREGNESVRITELKEVLADQTSQRVLLERIESLKSAAEKSRQLSQEITQANSQLVRDETLIEKWERVLHDWQQVGRSALEEVRRLLAEKTYAESARSNLAQLEAKLAAIGHDPDALAAARSRRASLSAVPQEYQKLLQAEAAVKPLIDGLADLSDQRERTAGRVVDLEAQEAEVTQRLQELDAGIGDLRAAEAELQRLREGVVTADRVAEGARQRLGVLAIRREDLKRLAAEKTGMARRVSLLRQLEEACGRKGVQALLIEAALPEIEEHTNELLDRLTGGDMRVSFDTQKVAKTKQDNLIETLDIKIADSTGERPYENYSGGEKFRINFAIRLALSQVLAHRAGARLQSLVIDEGFGSQDPEGRQRLVEAINAIQDKFACILVITHIDELRDKFPARIDVEKTANGSRLSVITI